MSKFARGTHSLGECDRCGLTFRLHELRCEIVNGQLMNDRVCPDCWNPDHPQLQVGKRPVIDIEALFNPRPDRRPPDLTNIRWGWRPVYSLEAKGLLGTVTIVGAVDTDPVTNQPPQSPTVFTDFILPAFATTLLGDITPSIGIEVGVDGVAASTFVGATSQIQSSLTPDGVQATGAVGTTTQTGKANIGVSSVTSTMLLGTPTVSARGNVSVSGLSATAAVGTPVILLPVGSVDIVLTPTGVQGAGAVGSVTATGRASTALTGLSATSALGTAQGSSQFAGTATGVTATGAVGTTTQSGRGRHTLTGLSAVTNLGSVSVSVPLSAPQIATTSYGTLPSSTGSTVTLPSGTVAGDLLVLEASTLGSSTLSVPSGWTALQNQTTGATTSHVRGAMWYKIAGSAEPGVAITVAPAAEMAFTLARVTGFDPAGPIDVSAGNIGTGPTVAFPTMTTTVTNTRIMAAISLIIGTASSTTPPSGYNLIVDQGISLHAQNTSHKSQPAAGSTGSTTGSIVGAGASQPWVSQLVAIRGTADTGGTPTGPSTTINYTAHDTDIANPERGFTNYMATSWGNNAAAYFTSQRSNGLRTLFHYLLHMNDYRIQALPQSYLDLITNQLTAARAGGAKVVIRASYDQSVAGADTSLTWIQTHIDQLAPIINSFKDICPRVDAGFVGGWGEWAYSQNFGNAGNANTEQGLNTTQWNNRKAVTDKMLSAFDTSIEVGLRVPNFKRRMYGTTQLTDADGYGTSDMARLAFYNDAYVSSANDFNTYISGLMATEQTYMNNENKYVSFGGESAGYTVVRSDGASAHNENVLLRTTYLSDEYHPDVLNAWKAQTAPNGDTYYNYIRKRLGYRLRLTSATLPTTLTSGGQIQVTLNIVNDGYAAPLTKRPVRIVLRNTANSAVQQITMVADPRRWLPGTTHVVTETLTLPPLSAGNYEMLLNLPDASASLTTNPLYSIQLANTGVWESTTGFNKLNHTATRP